MSKPVGAKSYLCDLSAARTPVADANLQRTHVWCSSSSSSSSWPCDRDHHHRHHRHQHHQHHHHHHHQHHRHCIHCHYHPLRTNCSTEYLNVFAATSVSLWKTMAALSSPCSSEWQYATMVGPPVDALTACQKRHNIKKKRLRSSGYMVLYGFITSQAYGVH